MRIMFAVYYFFAFYVIMMKWIHMYYVMTILMCKFHLILQHWIAIFYSLICFIWKLGLAYGVYYASCFIFFIVLIRPFLKLSPELSQRKMRQKRKSICFYLLFMQFLIAYSFSTVICLTVLTRLHFLFFCGLIRSFQFHDVFNLDNDNRQEDTPTLIDRKVM